MADILVALDSVGRHCNRVRTANAPNKHATAASEGLMIVRPIRSHVNAESAKASVVTPATMSSRVAVEVGKCVVSSSIAASYYLLLSA
jgi:hypothetical protein